MSNPLLSLLNQKAIHPLSYFFAQFIAEQSGQAMDSVLCITAALVSHQNQMGDICIRLADYAGKNVFELHSEDETIAVKLPTLDTWKAALQIQECVGTAGQKTPLILENNFLYLGQQWHFEDNIVKQIKQRLAQTVAINEAQLAQGLSTLFPPNEETVDWQKVAASLVVNQAFSVISGGPGTGKTTTLIKVVALLLAQNETLNIQLCAPTGKAAIRMLEAMNSRKNELGLEQAVIDKMPQQAKTIHRLLAYRQGQFVHNKSNLLCMDCLIIDEASMVDMALMAHLMAALPAECRIILLGDKDQLSSVDAGHVFSDICGRGDAIVYSSAQNKRIAQRCAIDVNLLEEERDSAEITQAISLLKTSYRFKQHGGIGQLAHQVNTGQGDDAIALLQAHTEGLGLFPNLEDGCDAEAIALILKAYEPVVSAKTVEQAIALFDQFQLLCAVHNGPFGVNTFNELISQRLWLRKKINRVDEYNGQPILITQNDAENNLYNGDIGILWQSEGQFLVYFKQADGAVISHPLISLNHYETAWAITVHKSQGSEYESVMMVLPNSSNGLIKRELIYTGITRAKTSFYCCCDAQQFSQACRQKTQRSSQLAAKLGW